MSHRTVMGTESLSADMDTLALAGSGHRNSIFDASEGDAEPMISAALQSAGIHPRRARQGWVEANMPTPW